MGTPYTREEIERAIEMSERHGLTWPEIEAMTGREQRSLKATVSRFRNGKWGAPSRTRSKQINTEIEALIASGVTSITDIAKHFGYSYLAMYMRLKRMGHDAETIREAADMARLAA